MTPPAWPRPRARRLTPAPAFETGREVAASLLAQRGITDPPAGLGIDLTLLQGFAGIDLPAQDETTSPFDFGTAAAPAPRPAAPAAATPEPAGSNLSVSV